MRLENKIAVVTGSSRGIGREIALRFVSEGAKLVINCRSTVEKGKAVQQEIQRAGGEAIVVRADVGARRDADRLIARTLAHYGRIDILVSNAGIVIDKPFIDNTDDDWERALHSNAAPFFFLARAALPHMIKRKSGRIVVTGSIITDRYDFGGNKMAVCTAAKAAAGVMLRSVATEVAPHGVTINAVSPGYIATEMFSTIDAKGLAAAKKLIPMGRFGKPADIAGAMVFLASDEAGYITGQTLRVNGGMAMA